MGKAAEARPGRRRIGQSRAAIAARLANCAMAGDLLVIGSAPVNPGAVRPSRIMLPDGPCTVLDGDGHLLARAGARITSDRAAITLDHVNGNGGLLEYYFAKAGRTVEVRAGGVTSSGSLLTHWGREGRCWEVRFESPAPGLDGCLPGTPHGRSSSRRRSSE